MLFPQPYMPPGSKGPAVIVLQLLLLALDYNDDIVPNGEYDEPTVKAVRAFQDEWSLEADGCFGPDTRAKFLAVFGVDVNVIPDLNGETTVPPEVVDQADVITQTMQ